MKIQTGEILLSSNGQYYRVVDCHDNIVSLKRVDGYTLFSCHIRTIESQYQPVAASKVTDSVI